MRRRLVSFQFMWDAIVQIMPIQSHSDSKRDRTGKIKQIRPGRLREILSEKFSLIQDQRSSEGFGVSGGLLRCVYHRVGLRKNWKLFFSAWRKL